MGAGDGSGPQRCGQAGQAGRKERSERELWHEHADDEQRIRYGDVAQRRVSGVSTPAPRERRFDTRAA